MPGLSTFWHWPFLVQIQFCSVPFQYFLILVLFGTKTDRHRGEAGGLIPKRVGTKKASTKRGWYEKVFLKCMNICSAEVYLWEERKLFFHATIKEFDFFPELYLFMCKTYPQCFRTEIFGKEWNFLGKSRRPIFHINFVQIESYDRQYLLVSKH